MNRKRLFIVGSYRTGTTILWRFMRDLGYELLFESNYMGFNEIGSYQKKVSRFHKPDVGWKQDLESRINLDKEHFGYSFTPNADVDLSFLTDDLEKKQKILQVENEVFGDKEFVGEKSVVTLPSLHERAKLFPDAFYLFTIRDPLHVCYSCLKDRESNAYWNVDNPEEAVKNVVFLFEQIIDFWENEEDVPGEALWMEQWIGNREENIQKISNVPGVEEGDVRELNLSLLDLHSNDIDDLVSGTFNYKKGDKLIQSGEVSDKWLDKLREVRKYFDYV